METRFLSKSRHLREELDHWLNDTDGPEDSGELTALEAVDRVRALFPAEVEAAERLPWDHRAIALAELANWFAKVTGDYGPKVTLFAAAVYAGVEAVWSDGVLYLSAPGIGECSAHDPHDQIWEVLERLGCQPPTKEHAWCGIRRQHWAPLLCLSAGARRLMDWAQAHRLRNETVDRLMRRVCLSS